VYITDTTSWLQQLGYEVSNILPSMDFSGRFNTQSSSQATVSRRRLLPVTSAFECAYNREMDSFLHTSSVHHSKISELSVTSPVRMLAPVSYVFGPKILVRLRGADGHVSVNILEGANEKMALLATTLLNNSYAAGPMFTDVHGRDVHHFIKSSLEEVADDIRQLSSSRPAVDLSVDSTSVSVEGLNVTVHAHHNTEDNVVRYVDVHLHSEHTAIALRYGTTQDHEQDRVLRHARLRAVEAAWVIERELVQSGKRSVNAWTRLQREELLSKGYVIGVRAVYLRDVKYIVELSGDPRNIRFESNES